MWLKVPQAYCQWSVPLYMCVCVSTLRIRFKTFVAGCLISGILDVEYESMKRLQSVRGESIDWLQNPNTFCQKKEKQKATICHKRRDLCRGARGLAGFCFGSGKCELVSLNIPRALQSGTQSRSAPAARGLCMINVWGSGRALRCSGMFQKAANRLGQFIHPTGTQGVVAGNVSVPSKGTLT